MKKLRLLIIVLIVLSQNAFSQKDTAQMKKEFVPSGKLWGNVFVDYTDKIQSNSFNMSNTQYAITPKDFTMFDFRRVYLGYDYEISERFSTQFLLSYEGQTTSDGSRTVYLKAANIRYKGIYKNADLVVGQMQTPTFSTASDPTWGYRSLERTLLDMRKIGTSYDMGVSLQGKFTNKGDCGYTLMIANGSGAKPENDKFKKEYIDVWAKFMDQKIIIDMGADNEISQITPYKKYKTTLKVFAAYQTPEFTFGLEAFSQLQKNNTLFTEPFPSTIKDTVNAMSSGISVFAKGAINSKVGWVLRYDHYNPDTKFNMKNVYAASYPSFFTESFVLAGIDFTVIKNIHIIPNIWFDSYNNRDIAFNHLSKNSYDLAARITGSYLFK